MSTNRIPQKMAGGRLAGRVRHAIRGSVTAGFTHPANGLLSTNDCKQSFSLTKIPRDGMAVLCLVGIGGLVLVRRPGCNRPLERDVKTVAPGGRKGWSTQWVGA